MVAPLVGAWIEMSTVVSYFFAMAVAPLVGAWIEIGSYCKAAELWRSLPSWERGLKFKK